MKIIIRKHANGAGAAFSYYKSFSKILAGSGGSLFHKRKQEQAASLMAESEKKTFHIKSKKKKEERKINICENDLKNDWVFYLAIVGRESFKKTFN